MESIIDLERLKLALQRKAIDQSELAKRVGCTPGAINQIFSGTTQRSRFFPDIARELNCSMEYLLGRTDNPALSLNDLSISSEEHEVLAQWRNISRAQRNAIMILLKSLRQEPDCDKS